jgi:outer membrane protein insertion porin family
MEKGFYNAVVKVIEQPDEILENSVKLIFDVRSGERVKIEKLEFVGVSQMSEKKLRRTMKSTKQRNFFRVFKASKYIENEYADDKKKVIAKYNKEGFRNAKIVSDSVYVINKERIGIRIQIDEDKKFYFRNISFAGNTKYRTTTLDSILNINKGDIYDLEMLSSRISFNPNGRDISSLYTDDGYLNFYAFPVETIIFPDSIDVEIRMEEGRQYRIGNVSVMGNTKTNDRVIYRELKTRPGDLFNRSDLMRSQRDLMNLGHSNQRAP